MDRARASSVLSALAFGVTACGGSSTPPDGSRADVIAADRTDALDTRVDTDVAPPSDASDAVMDAGVDAGEPAVRFVGRIDRTDSAGPRFGWSGSGIVARFHGTSVSVSLRDPGNYFHVLVDGTAQPTLQAMSGTTAYPLANGLADADHVVEIWRRTEACNNATQFLGFDFGAGGTLLPPPPAPTRRIELIGDSISCGYGDEGTSSACHFMLDTENHYLAYGSIAARMLGAELHTIAWSGYGMYRGYNGATTETVPSVYDRALPTVDTSNWDFTSWTPDAVVINLGTNDWAQGDPGTAYTDAYVAFVQRLRTHYPNAFILASIGPTHAPGARIDAALTQLRNAGDTRLGYLEYDMPPNEWGCDYHPNLVAQAAMGAQLAASLRTSLGW